MNPSFSSFTKLEHKSDESAWWGLCRAPPKVWQPLVLYFLASCLDRREEEYRKRLVLYCPLNICFLWEKQSQWFQPSGLQGSLQTKHISGSFRKNILKVFGLQGNTLNRQLILSRLFFLALSHIFSFNILLNIRLYSVENRKFLFSLLDIGP